MISFHKYSIYSFCADQLNEMELELDNDTSFIPDLPSGPLDPYRKKATFDWKKLRLVFEEVNLLRVKVYTLNAICILFLNFSTYTFLLEIVQNMEHN